MQPEPSPDDMMISQLSMQVAQSSHRFSLLQSDAQEITSDVLGARDKTRMKYADLSVQNTLLQQEIDELGGLLEQLSGEIRKMSGRFRYVIKNDLLSSLQRRVDDLPYERLITRREFDVLIDDQLRLL